MELARPLPLVSLLHVRCWLFVVLPAAFQHQPRPLLSAWLLPILYRHNASTRLVLLIYPAIDVPCRPAALCRGVFLIQHIRISPLTIFFVLLHLATISISLVHLPPCTQ